MSAKYLDFLGCDPNYIAIDIETYDPQLMSLGSGSIKKNGFVCGISIANDRNMSEYYPIRHSEGNEDLEKVKYFIKPILECNLPKIGANLIYDIAWLKCDLGLDVKGKLYDIQVAEPLIDETRKSYSLDFLSSHYLGQTKFHSELIKAGYRLYGDNYKEDEILKMMKQNMHNLPADLIRSYAIMDAELPISIFLKQKKLLMDIDCWDLFDKVESVITRILCEMFFKGVRIDIQKAELLVKKMESAYDELYKKIVKLTKKEINIWSAAEIVPIANTLGVELCYTGNGNISMTSDWLKKQSNEYFALLLQARETNRLLEVFLKSHILGNVTSNNRIHCNFIQTKGERGGTEIGRFSCCNPNLQQIPTRSKLYGKEFRSLFLAEEGKQWLSADYSQQEFRIGGHYAYNLHLSGSDKIVDAYNNNEDTDYHQLVAELTNLDRKTAKQVNLGMSYGMGKKTFSTKYLKSAEDTDKIFKSYHDGMPQIKLLSDFCKNIAEVRGYIKTILGRRRHFNLFGPTKGSGVAGLQYQNALDKWGNNIKRYYTYRAVQNLISGTAADMIKMAMIRCYQNGFVPCLTVHDELDFCDIENDDQISIIKDCMVNAIKLDVKMKVDTMLSTHW